MIAEKNLKLEKRRLVLLFPAEIIDEPITYNLVKEYDIVINILNADITHGKEGNLLIEMKGVKTNLDEALVYLNIVRLRANVEALRLSNDAQVFEDAILTERAKELAFEGKRWFDLLRMGRRNNYANKDKLIEILVQDVPSTQKLVQKAKLSNPLGWYMPIHINEIERNRNITQNPYYYESN